MSMLVHTAVTGKVPDTARTRNCQEELLSLNVDKKSAVSSQLSEDAGP